MKWNHKKIIIPIVAVLAIAAAAAYFWLPGTKAVAKQGIRATKAAAAHYLPTESVDASNIRQVITADSTTSRTFMWQSDYAEDDPVVEFRKTGDDDTIMALPASSDAFSDDGVTTYIHSATVTDLTPGTAYEYRVGYGDKRSSWTPFHTAEGSSFKALIFPDSQSSDYSGWASLAQAAWQNNQDAQFFVNMGDLVDNGQSHYQWNAWFDAVGPMISRIPVAPLMGNHETYNTDWKMRMPEAYTHLFALPHIDMDKYQNQFYSFDYGDIHFVVLNTQAQELADFEPTLNDDEVAWFKEDMAKTTKKWKVVLMHKDPCSTALPTARNLVKKDSRRKDGCGCPYSTSTASMPSCRPISTPTATEAISRTSSAMKAAPYTSSPASPATSATPASGSSTASMNTSRLSRKRTTT